MGAPVKETIIINRAEGAPTDIGPWSLVVGRVRVDTEV